MNAGVLLSAVGAMALCLATAGLADGGKSVSKTQMQAEENRVISAEMARASDLIGAEAVNATGERIGKVEDVVFELGPEHGARQVSVLISAEERPGGDSALIALGLDQLELQRIGMNKHELRVRVSMTKEQIGSPSAGQGGGTRAPGPSPSGKNQDGRQIIEDGRWMAVTTVDGSDLIGSEVVNDEGRAVGEVEDLLINTAAPEPDVVAVLSLGEGLGFGGREVMIQLKNLEVQQKGLESDDIRAVARISQDQFKRLPTYEERWK